MSSLLKKLHSPIVRHLKQAALLSPHTEKEKITRDERKEVVILPVLAGGDWSSIQQRRPSS
jgi:hypothetical protein